MTRDTAITRCTLTTKGLHQAQGHGCPALLEASAYQGEVMILAGVGDFGAIAFPLHLEDAQHFVGRMQSAIDLARSLDAEAAEPATSRLNADGDRMPIRPASVEHHAV